MPKGRFTQAACVLLEEPVSLDQMEAALSEFEVLGRRDASEEWPFGGPTLAVAYRPESNGLVAIDIVDRPWPDHMGDPQQEPMVFGAWTLGHFGPFTYPNGLQRAAQQSWTWEEGRTIPARHNAFVRILTSYAFGASGDDPVFPNDYESLPELEFVTRLASALLDLPGALCYFNPNGEILLDQNGLRESLNYGWSNKLPPLDAWTNVRMFKLDAAWSLMDTVGNGQLDLADAEACFHSDAYDFNEVANFLRNVSLYLLNNGEVIEDGDTMDGPGEIRWQARAYENGICDPPRRVLRWLPMDDRPVPPEIPDAGTEA